MDVFIFAFCFLFMQYKIFASVTEAYKRLNPATLSGAIDAIIVEQPDGTYLSSPFHVRFGKLGILQPKEREIDIEVNGRVVDLKMILDDLGTAYFGKQVYTFLLFICLYLIIVLFSGWRK